MGSRRTQAGSAFPACRLVIEKQPDAVRRALGERRRLAAAAAQARLPPARNDPASAAPARPAAAKSAGVRWPAAI